MLYRAKHRFPCLRHAAVCLRGSSLRSRQSSQAAGRRALGGQLYERGDDPRKAQDNNGHTGKEHTAAWRAPAFARLCGIVASARSLPAGRCVCRSGRCAPPLGASVIPGACRLRRTLLCARRVSGRALGGRARIAGLRRTRDMDDLLLNGPGTGVHIRARRAAALFLHVPLLHVRPPFRLIFTDTKSSPIYKILYPVCPRCSTVIPATF